MGVFKRHGFWWADWYEPDGRRRRKKVSPEKRVAVAFLRGVQAKIARGEYLGLREETITFRAFAERYWEAVKPTLSPQEQDRAKRILDQHLIPRFGPERLSRLTRREIEAYVAERAGQVKPGTVNKELIRLRHLLNKAVAWGYLKANPCQGVKPLKEPPPRVRFLVPEQVGRLLDACSRRAEDLRSLVTLAMHTGMRQGEILSLTWADVDLDGRTITLRKTKNNELRTVPLNTEATDALNRLSAPDDTSAHVFPGWTSDRLKAAFRRSCRQAGIADFRFHDLRHHAASWLTMKGVNQRTIEAIFGWKTPQTARRYQHLSTAALHEAVKLLESRPVVEDGVTRGEGVSHGQEAPSALGAASA